MATENHRAGGTLTLTGESRVQAKPDIATIDLGVVTKAATAQEAVSQNAELMSQVLDRIKALGIPAEDLQTVGFRVIPVVDSQENSPTYGRIISYRVEDTLQVRASVALIGRVLDEGVGAGANVVGQLSFGLREEEAYRHQALQAAVKRAYSDAEFLAHTMGITLRGTTSVDLHFGGNPVLLRGALSADEAATPIEAGSVTISASVRMVFTYETAGGKPRVSRPRRRPR